MTKVPAEELVLTVTVYVPAFVMYALSLGAGTWFGLQLAAKLQSPPLKFVQTKFSAWQIEIGKKPKAVAATQIAQANCIGLWVGPKKLMVGQAARLPVGLGLENMRARLVVFVLLA